MANYNCVIRTSYFRVKDESAFRDVIGRVDAESMHLWDTVDKNGNKVFAFGVYGSLYGFMDEGEDEADFDGDNVDAFYNALKDCVAEDDAIIIMTAGHEKLNYVVGSAFIITSTECKDLNIAELAVNAARKMLGNPDWPAICEY